MRASFSSKLKVQTTFEIHAGRRRLRATVAKLRACAAASANVDNWQETRSHSSGSRRKRREGGKEKGEKMTLERGTRRAGSNGITTGETRRYRRRVLTAGYTRAESRQ